MIDIRQTAAHVEQMQHDFGAVADAPRAEEMGAAVVMTDSSQSLPRMGGR